MPTGVYERTPEGRANMSRAARGNTNARGRVVTPELRERARIAATGNKNSVGRYGVTANERNGMWKGDEVSYSGMHAWIYRRKGPAREGVCAFADSECHGRLEHANISGSYLRDVEDYMVLCSTHHARYDLRGVRPARQG